MPNSYKLELSPAAKGDLTRLPISAQKDIVFKYLPEMQEIHFQKLNY